MNLSSLFLMIRACGTSEFASCLICGLLTNAAYIYATHKTHTKPKGGFWIYCTLILSAVAMGGGVPLGGVSSPTVSAWFASLCIAIWFIGYPLLLRAFGLVTAESTKTASRIFSWWLKYVVSFITIAITLFGLPLAFKYASMRLPFSKFVVCSWTVTLLVHYWGALRQRFNRSGGPGESSGQLTFDFGD